MALAEALCDEYDVAPDDALTDVMSIVEQWKNVNVVE